MYKDNEMNIIYRSENQQFHLFNQEISYIFKISEDGKLLHLYYGENLPDNDYSHLIEMHHRPMTTYRNENDLLYSLEHLKQEFPEYGTTDFRHPAISLLQKNGSRLSDFVYQGYEVEEGKPKLEGLPATYVDNNDESKTLKVYILDSVTNVQVELLYTIYRDYPVITRSARVMNKGKDIQIIENISSLSLDLPDANYEWQQLSGAWGRERTIKSRTLQQGIQSIESTRGISSHQHNPFVTLKRKNTDENQGEAIGAALVYSGNFLIQAEVDTWDVTRLQVGINPFGFNWKLNPGEIFTAPEAILVYSSKGLNAMSQTFHQLFRKRLARGKWREKDRPVLINNWEATYFDFDEEKIMSIVKTAKSLGVELFVLDDGWFGERNDDTRSLGDWYPNLEKLPDGITGIAKRVEAEGMKFGLWFEPEMVNKNSRLYREHPDWILGDKGRRLSHGRNQYVLDFSRDEVVDAIFGQMYKVLSEAPISYVKWDMNRSMSEVYSAGVGSGDQGKVLHRYILGVYRLYDMLTKAFPKILFESCASGGGRFDPGLLYYAPQCWTSDDTDAVERCKIQYGTSLVYPVSSMGSHVSAVPNHQLLRNTSLEMRANVAYFGTFGYELDPNRLTEEEKEEVKEQIGFMKKYRRLIQFGTFYRLVSPFEGNEMAWMVVSEDQRNAIVGYYRILQTVNGPYRKIRLQGLDPDKIYHVSRIEEDLYGDELLWYGLDVSDASSGENREEYNGRNGDYQSKLFLLSSIE